MYIHEAIAARTSRERYITRKCWDYPYEACKGLGASIKLNPTNSPDLCIILSVTSGLSKGWCPSADDLTADDWIAVR